MLVVSLPSATKLWQGNDFTPVCHSVHGGACLRQCMLGYTPILGRHPPGQTPAPPADTPWPDIPQPDTPTGQTVPLLARHPPGRHPPGQAPPSNPQQTAIAADGTHPTGMHSCFCTHFSLLKSVVI